VGSQRVARRAPCPSRNMVQPLLKSSEHVASTQESQNSLPRSADRRLVHPGCRARRAPTDAVDLGGDPQLDVGLRQSGARRSHDLVEDLFDAFPPGRRVGRNPTLPPSVKLSSASGRPKGSRCPRGQRCMPPTSSRWPPSEEVTCLDRSVSRVTGSTRRPPGFGSERASPRHAGSRRAGRGHRYHGLRRSMCEPAREVPREPRPTAAPRPKLPRR
jgi:hypothetical protein